MSRKNSAAVIAIALAAGLFGYILGPPIVQAATGTVKVSSGSGGTQLKVARSMALVDTEAGSEPAGVLFSGNTILTSVDFGYVLQQAGGNFLIAQGTSSATACANTSILASIVVDSPSGGTVSITADTDRNGTGGDPAWQGTVQAGGHLDDQMDGGLYAQGPLVVTSSGASTHWYLYGLCFTNGSAVAKAIMHSHRFTNQGS